MKTRILQFIGSFHQGGSERQAVQLVRLLKNDGRYDIRVATLDAEGPLRSDIEALEIYEIAEFRLSSFYNLQFLRQLIRCIRFLKQNQIDLIHTHDFYTNVFGMLTARLAGVRCRIASKRETEGMRTANQDRLERFVFGFADRIAANSGAVKEHLSRRGIDDHKMAVVYNGIDLSRFEAQPADRDKLTAQLGLPGDENIKFVTMVANLRHEVKNHPMLLRAAKQIADGRQNVHFVLAGEGSLENNLRQIAEDLGIDKRVHFIGRCSRVPELLSVSFAGVLTSFAEGFSNSILEYMAAGLPVVATKVGGAAEAVRNGITGYLIGSDDDKALAERLSGLLSDPAKADEMGRRGREIVRERFSTEAQLAAVTELYSSLCAPHSDVGT